MHLGLIFISWFLTFAVAAVGLFSSGIVRIHIEADEDDDQDPDLDPDDEN